MENGSAGEGLTYEKASKARMILTYVGATNLVLVAIMKIVEIGEMPPPRIIITCLFLIGLAIIMTLVERGYPKAQQFFLFLNYGIGKAAIYIYLIVLTVSNAKTEWLQILITVIFGLTAAFEIFISVKFKEEESQRIKVIFDSIEK